MGTSSVADQGAPKRLWKTRERVESSEAAECPPCAHTPFATYRVFFFPFEPLWELRKEVELNARKLRRFP